MNHKKIRRLMSKYDLVTKIRKKILIRKWLKLLKNIEQCPNLLNREFNQDEPGKVLLTDITYLKWKWASLFIMCERCIYT